MLFKTPGLLAASQPGEDGLLVPALVPGAECSGLFVSKQLRFLGLVFFGRDGPGVPGPLQVNQLLADARVLVLGIVPGAAAQVQLQAAGEQ